MFRLQGCIDMLDGYRVPRYISNLVTLAVDVQVRRAAAAGRPLLMRRARRGAVGDTAGSRNVTSCHFLAHAGPNGIARHGVDLAQTFEQRRQRSEFATDGRAGQSTLLWHLSILPIYIQ